MDTPKWTRFEAPTIERGNPNPIVTIAHNAAGHTAKLNRAAAKLLGIEKGSRLDIFIEEGGTHVGFCVVKQGGHRVSVPAGGGASCINLYRAIGFAIGGEPQSKTSYALIVPRHRQGEKPVYAIRVKGKGA